MTKALVSVPAAMLVLICAMMLMTDTAAAATKYQVASPFMLQGVYRRITDKMEMNVWL